MSRFTPLQIAARQYVQRFEEDYLILRGRFRLEESREQASLENYALHSETYTYPMKMLSGVIRENHLERIGLLKVDVERSEVEEDTEKSS